MSNQPSGIPAIESLIRHIKDSSSQVASLVHPRTVAECRYLHRVFEQMRKESAISSILYDHPDDPTYGWGAFAHYESLCTPEDDAGKTMFFSIRHHNIPFPTPTLVFLRASVSETPVPFTNRKGIPFPPSQYYNLRKRLLAKAEKLPKELLPLLKLVRYESGSPPVLTSAPEKIIDGIP